MEKNQQMNPLAPSSAQNPSNDQESLRNHMEQERRQKRLKLAAYIAAFTVFQVIVILVFVLVIMKVRTPKFRVGTPRIQALTTSTAGSGSPSFNMTILAPIRLKNPNFGPYKYDSTTIVFAYGDATVGRVAIPKDKADFKSTKKIDATVTLSSSSLSGTSNSSLGTELSSGVLTLTSSANLNGKFQLMLIFKKKKSTSMDCTMKIDVSAQTVQSVTCK
ncbi:late embryogenesis abundant protein At1g64065-like [Rhodamnia argentea]|uniref:Late embryogenesis abundant protein At1g64065-like n=1 Tax=Rhodamnia argentea TaxID=178133 RepID=A0A8B8P672_9MYRT|nr:late embryogenesis abundant protein At1g64065-like [Rhodamnia argentea]